MPSSPETSGRAALIVVAAGRGTRFGDAHKVLADLGGHPVLAYSLDAAEYAAAIDEVVVVAGEHTFAQIEEIITESTWSKVRHVVAGGERRQDSVEAGLAAVGPKFDVVAIHDGARPFAPSTLFDNCVVAARRRGAAIAATAITDTLKRASGRTILETVLRADMWAAQTPQAFRTEILRSAFAFAHRNELAVTDEAGILEAMGIPVAIVESTSRNMKITTMDDLALARALLTGKNADKSS